MAEAGMSDAPTQRAELRKAELRKLQAFASNNDLAIQMADTKTGNYQGRMGVHTDSFITQHVGGRKLVVHDKAIVGRDMQPGMDVKIDYSARRGNQADVTKLKPVQARGITR